MIEIFTENLDRIEKSEFTSTTARNFFKLAVLAVRVTIYFVYVYENSHTSRIITSNENKTKVEYKGA